MMTFVRLFLVLVLAILVVDRVLRSCGASCCWLAKTTTTTTMTNNKTNNYNKTGYCFFSVCVCVCVASYFVLVGQLEARQRQLAKA